MMSGFLSSPSLNRTGGGGRASWKVVGGGTFAWSAAGGGVLGWRGALVDSSCPLLCSLTSSRPHCGRDRLPSRTLTTTHTTISTTSRPPTTPATTEMMGVRLISPEDWPFVGEGLTAAEGKEWPDKAMKKGQGGRDKAGEWGIVASGCCGWRGKKYTEGKEIRKRICIWSKGRTCDGRREKRRNNEENMSKRVLVCRRKRKRIIKKEGGGEY